MPVFTESPADYVEQELWVTSSTDSDHDGKKDLIHIDVTRPSGDRHGLKVPVVFEASPYYPAGNAVHNHNVDHKLYAPHGTAARPGRTQTTWGMTPRATTIVGPGVDQQLADRHLGAARLRRRARRVGGHRRLDGLPDQRRAQRDPGHQGGHRLAQRPRHRGRRAGSHCQGRTGRPARSA